MSADYGATYLDVQARIPYRTIDASSPPTQSQVGAWVEEAEARINNALRAGGMAAPVANAEGAEQLKALSIDYGEGRTRIAYASAGGDGGNDDGKDLIEQFGNVIDNILEHPARWSAMLQGGDASDATRRLRSHVLDHPDGHTVGAGDFDPAFTKLGGEDQW